MLTGARICVAGAGAMGSAVALALRDAGADVLLCDPAALGDNASGVAAGMLAPALEAAADPVSAGHFALLSAARDLWPALAARLGCEDALDRSGALWLGDPQARVATLLGVGASARPVDGQEAEALCPGLAATSGGAFTEEDWRLDPGPMLRALRAAFLEAGGRVATDRVSAAGAGGAVLASGRVVRADWTVLATGRADPALAPELEVLAPIKGQILRFAPGVGPQSGPTVRAEGVYVAPSGLGPAAGATMEPGRDDRVVEPAVSDRLRAAAAGIFPAMAGAPATAQAGVRAATPDGLPLIGRSVAEGVLLATGARRNGWLLAPLAARMLVDLLAGGEGGSWAGACDPRRPKALPTQGSS